MSLVAEATLECPECGSPMKLRGPQRGYGPFYGCVRYPECDGSHGAHLDGRPLGKPANRANKRMRIAAHGVFDILWKNPSFGMTRREAYNWLSAKMGAPGQVHIGEMSIDECQKVVDEVVRFIRGGLS